MLDSEKEEQGMTSPDRCNRILSLHPMGTVSEKLMKMAQNGAW
jgi:hypothetical protein